MIHGTLENIVFTGISTDTRTLKHGDLFFAILGEDLDGHDYIQEAEKKGAAGVVISKKIETTLPVILVEDTTKKLGEVTKNWRKKFTMPLIGLTGSNGKTTTKNMIAQIFSEKAKTLATGGNLNNHIGVPLMLARLDETYKYAVIEMGMNHFGEVAYLTKLAKPTTALITNAGHSHLAGVGNSVEGVAKAKGEIFEGLSSDGTAVINADSQFADYWKNLAKGKKIITFGIDNTADVKGELKGDGFFLHYKNENVLIKLKLLGRHNIMNALAASATALANNIEMSLIKTALEKVLPEHGRMETKKGLNNSIVIDDTYNANPLSFKAAIQSVENKKQQKILVLGDMRELGEHSVNLHIDCGKFAKDKGIDLLFAIGDLTQHTVKVFGENAKHFENHEKIVEALQPYLKENTLVLVKGSRSMKMEKVVNAITN